MGKLSTKKINISDYSKANQEDIAKLARSLNPLMDDLERILRGGLSVHDNLPFQYLTFTTEVDADSVPKSAVKLTTSLTSNVKGVIIINATSPNSTPTSAPWISYEVRNQSIEIQKVLGIPANTKFEITVLVVS